MIYVIRHGQTDWNKKGLIQSRADIPLNEEGIKQAETVRKQLTGINFKYVYASNLSRAVDTARIVSDNPVIIDERLTEISSGRFEGMQISEVKQIKNMIDYNPEEYGLETYGEVLERIDSFFREVIPSIENENTLIVTHGGTCKAVIQWFNQLKGTDYGEASIPKNCEIMTFENPKIQ